jgi:hypothetical protein
MKNIGNKNIEFVLKLIVFCVSYYFMLEYIVNCHISTGICSIIIFITIVVTTFVYLFSSKTI